MRRSFLGGSDHYGFRLRDPSLDDDRTGRPPGDFVLLCLGLVSQRVFLNIFGIFPADDLSPGDWVQIFTSRSCGLGYGRRFDGCDDCIMPLGRSLLVSLSFLLLGTSSWFLSPLTFSLGNRVLQDYGFTFRWFALGVFLLLYEQLLHRT